MEQNREAALDVAVVDDDPAVRDSLATILGIEGFQVQTYGSGDEFLNHGRQLRIDCLLLDVHMPARSGLDVLDAVGGAAYSAPIIMISGQADIPMAVTAIKSGAHDFIEKPFSAEAVISMIRDAVRAHRERSQSSSRTPSNRRFPGAETLTTREVEVLDRIAQGASNKEAGRLLGISPRTVEVHRARIMEKLGARNTADLMRIVLSPEERN